MYTRVRSCQMFRPRLIGTVRVVCPRYCILRPRYCRYKHTLTHSHTDTHTSRIVRPRSKAITRMCVCVCVCACVRVCVGRVNIHHVGCGSNLLHNGKNKGVPPTCSYCEFV